MGLINDKENIRSRALEYEEALKEDAKREIADLSVNHRKQVDKLEEAKSVLCNEQQLFEIHHLNGRCK